MKKRNTLLLSMLIISCSALFLNLIPPPPPPGPIAPFINGVFPKTTPGQQGSWELIDPLPGIGIDLPLRIIPFPNSSDILVLSKNGEIWRVSIEDQTKDMVLDFKDRAFKLGEAGAVGLILHPQFGDPLFPDKQIAFVFYRHKPEPDQWSEKGFNRLSKFTWDENTQTFDLNSEEILIQQFDRSTWHNGGAMFFGPEGYLYLTLGDEGMAEFKSASTQRLDGGLFSGLLRIDVDNDPTRSHPIKRQPIANGTPPDGWGTSFTQGYSIPNDNPWVTEDSSHLEEFYAIGIRSPYNMFYDAPTKDIWVTDVGEAKIEEINLIEKGDNLQWPYKEGTIDAEDFQKPEDFIGNEKPVYFEYDRTVGSCVIGGEVYRGTKFPELFGKYLFADFVQNKLMALKRTGSQSEPELEFLITNFGGQAVDIPPAPGITGIFSLENGEIFLTVMGKEDANVGKIFQLQRKVDVPDPPAKLSELGVFEDLETLTPIKGIIPYTVNSPLWSDRALKKRWMAIPNDGLFDDPEEQIRFNASQEWEFPNGTVFIKHFELPITDDPEGETVRLETRFFVMGEDGLGYGLTYQWNEDGTEAFLLGGGDSRPIEINPGGSVYTQTWDFPSRDQCISCHNANAKYVLGVKTHQLNGDLYYPDMGTTMNQLDYLNEHNVFHTRIGAPDGYPKAHPIGDEEIDLGLRIRSYLDANCASCHRSGGLPTVTMDLRFSVPLPLQNTINQPTQSLSSNPNRVLVKPGAHAESELWIRDASMTELRMPPLARNIIDEPYIDALAEWIDGLSDEDGEINEFLMYPNPAENFLTIRMSDQWTPPFQLQIFSLNGQLVYSENMNANTSSIDLSTFGAGVYVLEIVNGSERQVRRFIKK